MGAKKWSEIKKRSKATDADRAEAREELEAEIEASDQESPDSTNPR